MKEYEFTWVGYDVEDKLIVAVNRVSSDPDATDLRGWTSSEGCANNWDFIAPSTIRIVPLIVARGLLATALWTREEGR